ncbi:hypothetical protein SXIM_42720 [Streptomyces xiamenensis]|uniref:Uncharacterized protein n=1 Tax=Streptomyces xiamenensis TaxID=408015 RepID=A0A0F7CQ22_9ACTN|nr:hypothetical protein SXIM_42720 [Streptomyces xiamenensis]
MLRTVRTGRRARGGAAASASCRCAAQVAVRSGTAVSSARGRSAGCRRTAP